MAQGWLKYNGKRPLPSGSAVVKWSGDYALVDHDSIPESADHVALREGRFVVVPNPDSTRAAL